MINPSYLIEVNIILTLFYLFYQLLLRNVTFFGYNRFYLLITALLSFLLPIVDINSLVNFSMSPPQMAGVAANLNEVIIGTPLGSENEMGSLSHKDIFEIIYFSGVVVYCTMLFLKLFHIKEALSKPANNVAFSFFRKVKIDEKLPEKETILEHEKVHVRQWHSADIILLEILIIINWFNPVMYAYKKSVKHIHEYIADEKAAQLLNDKSNYALILLSQSMGVPTITLCNNFFNQSLLKRRIFMLHKEKSKKTAVLKYCLTAPLLVAIMVFSSAGISEEKENVPVSLNSKSEINDISQRAQNRISEKKENARLNLQSKSGIKNTSEKIQTLNSDSTEKPEEPRKFSELDVMPDFPGGMMAFYQYIGKNYKYPAEARKNGLSGRLALSFIVEKDGSLSDIKILRDLGMGTGDEAVRLLKESPKWKPGMQDEKAVRVAYTLPIMLSLPKETNTGDSLQKGKQIE